MVFSPRTSDAAFGLQKQLGIAKTFVMQAAECLMQGLNLSLQKKFVVGVWPLSPNASSCPCASSCVFGFIFVLNCWFHKPSWSLATFAHIFSFQYFSWNLVWRSSSKWKWLVLHFCLLSFILHRGNIWKDPGKRRINTHLLCHSQY